MKITTNSVWREILHTDDGEPYVKYKGQKLMLNDFVRIQEPKPKELEQWQAISYDSAFSGTLLILDSAGEKVIVGHYVG